MGGTIKDVCYKISCWKTSLYSGSFLIQLRTTCLGMSLPTMGQALLHKQDNIHTDMVRVYTVPLEASGSQPVCHNPFGGQMNYSQRSNIRYPVYQIFML